MQIQPRKSNGGNIRWYRLGSPLSLLMVGILVAQTMTFDPFMYFNAEILAQVEESLPMKPSDAFDSAPPLVLSNVDNSPSNELHLYRPSFWPAANATDRPGKGGDKLCRVTPSSNAISTSYVEDVEQGTGRFMAIDEKPIVVRSNISQNAMPNAACQFMPYQYSFQFPHMVQQLFRCWSFWREHPDKKSVFVTTKESHWNLTMDNEFNSGMINALRGLGVDVIYLSDIVARRKPSEDKQSISGHAKGPILNQKGNHFETTSVDEMRSLRQGVLTTLSLNGTIPSSFCQHPDNFPRIGILNRQHSRTIRNSKEIAQDLTTHFNLSYSIPVIQFEKASFRNQVGMMASIDLLVTPHGAQETGIAFMPICGGVLELIPEQYYFPRFFGTLAASAGLQHSFIYLSGNASDHTFDVLSRDVPFFCPSAESIREGVTLLVERWRSCCRSRITAE